MFEKKKCANKTKNWLLVLEIIKCLNESEYSVRVDCVIFEKICCILERYGTDLDLNSSFKLKKMYTILSNDNMIHEKDGLIHVSGDFKIDINTYSEKDKQNVNKTYRLFQRIKDVSQAKMLTTILYSYDQLILTNKNVTEDQLYEYIIDWKKRFNTLENEVQIREFTRYLTSRGFISVDYSMGIKDNLIY